MQDYAIHVRCPDGDEDTWMILEKREETLEQILKMHWDFECSVHGVQRQLPLEGNIKGTMARSRPAPVDSPKPAPDTTPHKGQRSSPRKPLNVPVLAYGWIKSQGSFHEETTTLVVNATGGLVTLTAGVEVGEPLFLINKATRAEQECRVAYVRREEGGRERVGIAFKHKAPAFWQVRRIQPRIVKILKVSVRGVDRNGNPFVQSAYTVNISRTGARLKGPGYTTQPGDVVEVKRGWRKARFRIVWTGPVGTPQADEIGIVCLEDQKNIWRVPASNWKSTGSTAMFR
jgi:hypothetical protein